MGYDFPEREKQKQKTTKKPNFNSVVRDKENRSYETPDLGIYQKFRVQIKIVYKGAIWSLQRIKVPVHWNFKVFK